MIKPCRIGFLTGTCPPSFSNFSTDEDEFEETDGSAVYGHTLLSQRPSTVEWTPNLGVYRTPNLVSFISTVDRYPIILRNMGGDFVCSMQEIHMIQIAGSGQLKKGSLLVMQIFASLRLRVLGLFEQDSSGNVGRHGEIVLSTSKAK